MGTINKRKRIRVVNTMNGQESYVYPDKILKTSDMNLKPPEKLSSKPSRGQGLIEAAKDIARKMGSDPDREV